MRKTGRIAFRYKSIETLMNDAMPGGAGTRIQHVHSLGSHTVPLPRLEIGAHFFRLLNFRETPSPGLWQSDSYSSVAPAVFVLNDVIVHSSAGILAVDEFVLSETLYHAAPETNGYRSKEGGIEVDIGELTELDGTALSILAGGAENHYHWIIECLGRLGLVPDNYKAAAQIILIPGDVAEQQRRILDMIDFPTRIAPRFVRRDESYRVRTLVLPWFIGAEFRFHPCIVGLFRAIASAAPSRKQCPERVYIDRRESPSRRLVNETEIIAALAKRGFVSVKLERLDPPAQIALFAHAHVIVAPHGAGLANLVFASSGCKVIELHMDCYVNWCFRNLSALFDLQYDCVVGRALGEWTDLSPAVHGMRWIAPVTHTLAAVDHALRNSAPMVRH